MDALVQLIRNALCCIKDLNLFNDTVLYDPKHTAQYYDFPAPLNKTTPLEALISISQLYVVIFASKSGFNLLVSSIGKFRRIERLLALQQQAAAPKSNSKTTTTTAKTASPATSDADRLLNSSLIQEGILALRNLMVGLLVLFIGLSFFWLFANSWHVTETDWLGGPEGLIHALTVMEVCLLPLLYYMHVDGNEHATKATRMLELSNQLKSGATADSVKISTLADLQILSTWVPFYSAGVGLFAQFAIDAQQEEKLLAQELKKVQDILTDFAGGEDGSNSKKKDDSSNNKADAKARQEYLAGIADELVITAKVVRMQGFREFVYFIINSIAFYGYFVSILVFYWKDEASQPAWLRQYALFNLSNADADWYGNFYGDLMWTIEPMIILSSPLLLESMKTTSPKKQQQQQQPQPPAKKKEEKQPTTKTTKQE